MMIGTAMIQARVSQPPPDERRRKEAGHGQDEQERCEQLFGRHD